VSDPFLAEIRMFGFNFAPTGWALCDGQIMPIGQNTALFALLGTMYGGDGATTFALPNLQGAAPLQTGQGPGLSDRAQGETGGQVSVTLTEAEMPSHNHALGCGTASGASTSPGNAVWAAARLGRSGINTYAPTPGATPPAMSAAALAAAGGSQPHNNMPPFLTLNFCIALQGIFPSRG
jgi:microcystin-dependent protein